jgi:hypothetical protein
MRHSKALFWSIGGFSLVITREGDGPATPRMSLG